MKRVPILLALLLTVLVMANSCGKRAMELESGPTVIGHIQHRDVIVTMKSGTVGTLYSARNNEGRILFESLTEEQLKAQSPQIYDLIDPDKTRYGYQLLKPPTRLDRINTIR